MKKGSGQTPRRYRLMREPGGPQRRRIDTVVDQSAWEMFRDIRDSMNLTQQQALEFALQLAFLFQILQGKIPQDRFLELASTLMPKSKRAGHSGKDAGPGEPEPAR